MHISELMDVATGYWKSAVLVSAVELGIFDVLADGPISAAQLSDRLKSAPVQTEEILNALTGLGILEKDRDRFSVTASLQQILDPNLPGRCHGRQPILGLHPIERSDRLFGTEGGFPTDRLRSSYMDGGKIGHRPQSRRILRMRPAS